MLQEKESAIERWHEAEQEIDRLQQQLQVIIGWGVCQSIPFRWGSLSEIREFVKEHLLDLRVCQRLLF